MQPVTHSFDPTPADRFTFGLWTVGNTGRDPFGEPVRPRALPGRDRAPARRGGRVWASTSTTTTSCRSTPARPSGTRSSATSSSALAETGLTVPMATTNLFSDPAFKDGAFTSNDARVRAYALQKTMRGDRPRRRARRRGLRLLGRPRGRGDRRREEPARRHQALARGPQLPLRLREGPALRPHVRARGQAERAARRHLPADDRRDAGLHRDAGRPGDGRREPRGRPRAHGRPQLPPRGRAGVGSRASCSTST